MLGLAVSSTISSRLTRRTLLRGAAALALLPSALLGACAQATPTATQPTAAAGRLQLPTYVPFNGPKPDFAGSADGVAAGYNTFPSTLTKSVTTPPGRGGDVTIVDIITGPPPPDVSENAAWQAWNKLLNVNLKFNAASPQDYVNKFSTTVAGGDLPDVMSVPIQLFLPSNLPQLLESQFADLTPFLAGDAIKQFPNLANLPPSGWPNVVYNGKLYGLPLVRSGRSTLPCSFSRTGSMMWEPALRRPRTTSCDSCKRSRVLKPINGASAFSRTSISICRTSRKCSARPITGVRTAAN